MRVVKETIKNRPYLYSVAKRILRPIRFVQSEFHDFLKSYRVVRGLDLLLIAGGGQLGEYCEGPSEHSYTFLSGRDCKTNEHKTNLYEHWDGFSQSRTRQLFYKTGSQTSALSVLSESNHKEGAPKDGICKKWSLFSRPPIQVVPGG